MENNDEAGKDIKRQKIIAKKNLANLYGKHPPQKPRHKDEDDDLYVEMDEEENQTIKVPKSTKECVDLRDKEIPEFSKLKRKKEDHKKQDTLEDSREIMTEDKGSQ